MEKLLQLLNEYWKGSSFQFTGYDRELSVFNTNLKAASITSIPEETIISKKFWFIQWLVDTEQFDYWKVGEIENTYQWSLREKVYVVSDCVYESMLMLLAIQDDPISFLISILK